MTDIDPTIRAIDRADRRQRALGRAIWAVVVLLALAVAGLSIAVSALTNAYSHASTAATQERGDVGILTTTVSSQQSTISQQQYTITHSHTATIALIRTDFARVAEAVDKENTNLYAIDLVVIDTFNHAPAAQIERDLVALARLQPPLP